MAPQARLSLTLSVLPGDLSVCRLDPGAPVPAWLDLGARFVSLTRTRGELSVVCATSRVPAGVAAETGWRALKVESALSFGMTGVVASLAVPMANAKVSLFAISTYDSDYMLVKSYDLDRALDALVRHGHWLAAGAGDAVR